MLRPDQNSGNTLKSNPPFSEAEIFKDHTSRRMPRREEQREQINLSERTPPSSQKESTLFSPNCSELFTEVPAPHLSTCSGRSSVFFSLPGAERGPLTQTGPETVWPDGWNIAQCRGEIQISLCFLLFNSAKPWRTPATLRSDSSLPKYCLEENNVAKQAALLGQKELNHQNAKTKRKG